MGRDLLPGGESLRRAIRWVATRRREVPGTPLVQLVDEASRQFDLSPIDQDFLWRALAKGPGESADPDEAP